jgi:cysteinyl-tRNA synthetase
MVLFATLLTACSGSSNNDPVNPDDATTKVKKVETFMYQIQGLDVGDAVEALAGTHYDMLVVEPTATIKGDEDFDMDGMVETLKESGAMSFDKKLVVAYVDIGEAEEYRTYWQDDWVAPTSADCSSTASPNFILRADPDGWSENYPVAYWDDRWLDIMKGVFTEVANAGFDGAYLDWVEAYDDDCAIERAEEDGVDPADEMVSFVGKLRDHARTIRSDFIIISQNAPYLAKERPAYLDEINGLGVEDTFFGGEADADWDDPDCCDIPNEYTDDYSTENLINLFEHTYLTRHVPVFSTDYAIDPANVESAYERATEAGLIPLVTRVALSGITTTPPPSY